MPLFEPMPWKPFTGLKHLVFFDVLAHAPDGSPEAVRAAAGLRALRMLDHRALAGPVITAPESVSVHSARTAAMAVSEDDPLRRAVLGLVNGLQQTDLRSIDSLAPSLRAMADAYRGHGADALADDVEDTLRKYSRTMARFMLGALAEERERDARKQKQEQSQEQERERKRKEKRRQKRKDR